MYYLTKEDFEAWFAGWQAKSAFEKEAQAQAIHSLSTTSMNIHESSTMTSTFSRTQHYNAAAGQNQKLNPRDSKLALQIAFMG